MQIYLPEAQYPTHFRTLGVRSSSDAKGMIAAVRNEILAADKDQAVYNINTMEQLLADSISLRRFSMLLLISFAAIALMIAAVGIYGVISYSVTQRTHEIGIRMALGAGRREIVKLEIGQAMTMTLTGVTAGLAAAVGLTRVMESLLFNVSATDPLIFIIIPVVLSG